ncbi:GTP cyclohydrolase FolE2 [Solirubrobacter soli]|uniref:GTP cyclohydrolase FolE2 n=1 Tax=Solirubrobacter soli TaxID=363832 RepID=UPI0004803839|nr:GTP cyclohydrolase FolE2 [Solirubrobacter soli]
MNPLAALDLEDVQNQTDDRGVAIDQVGIADLRVPLRVAGRDGSVQQTIGTIEMDVDLAAEVKGTHMSRFVEALVEQNGPLDGPAVVALVHDVRSRLGSTRARVSMRFPYFLSRSAPVTGFAAPVDYDGTLLAEAGPVTSLTLGVRVPITSLCPCSKEISDYGAHNQRGYVEIQVRSDGESDLWLEDLIDIAEAAGSAPIFALLKRQDERHVTMQAYETPAFVEDIARDVAVALRSDARIAGYVVRVTNHESIHNHSAVATIRGGV